MKLKKKMTMQDIADLCGVTKSTVSRYFNGGYVKEETRRKIKETIEKNNYEPNTFAQSLKARESKIIGVIAPCLDSTVSSRIMMSIDEYLRKEGYTSLIINTDHDVALELKNMQSLWRMKVDGIILIATQVSEEHKTLTKRMDIPVVFVGQEYAEGTSIINDDYRAGFAIGEYIQKRGYQDVLYIGVDEHDEAVGIKRRQGVIDGCDPNLTKVEQLQADFSFMTSYDTVKGVLDHRLPQVIVCASDTMALGAFKAIQERNLRIPNDVSLIGFGGYEISTLITPKLTTIRFDNAAAGYLAAETILKLIREQPVSSRQVIGYTFLQGESA